jgi:hypothetical protein
LTIKKLFGGKKIMVLSYSLFLEDYPKTSWNWSREHFSIWKTIRTKYDKICIGMHWSQILSFQDTFRRACDEIWLEILFHLVAVPSDILIVSDTRTRKYHPLTYRQIHTSEDTYRHSFFPYTIPQWNQLPINTLNLVHIPSVVCFREQLTSAVLCNLL